ncbi:MAG: cell division protein FtsA [Alphaproteobacteria bacterium]
MFNGGHGKQANRSQKTRAGLAAGLDVGTSKICCFIAKVDDGRHPRVVGVGHHASEGLKSGIVVDMDAAEFAILNAVHAAEQMAGETIRSVVVNLTGGRLASHIVGVEVPISGHEIGDSDLRRVLDQSLSHNHVAERDVIHSIPVGFTIDGDRGIRDPRGMFGGRLGVRMHMITAASGAVRTLKTVVERCHLDIDSFVVSPYAAGLSCLVEDEMDLGVTLVDMGAGSTGITVFYDGAAVFVDAIPVGGGYVTSDIARGLSTPIAHAERLKTLYGSAIATTQDEEETVDAPQVGEDKSETPNHVSKALLNGIIQPRVEEIFELVRARLEDSAAERLAGRRVVLAGGACQLQGVRELAALVLDKQVRMGRPLRLRGLAESMAGPAFATCAGLIAFAVDNPTAGASAPVIKGEPFGLPGRIGQWLREHI